MIGIDRLLKVTISLTPVVVSKMNTRDPLVILDMNDFFDLIK